jgi:hypothetical protein
LSEVIGPGASYKEVILMAFSAQWCSRIWNQLHPS